MPHVQTAWEAGIAAEYADLLHLPSPCRQTLEACAKSGRPVNIKKGQFLLAGDSGGIGQMRAFGCDEFMMCERGTSFGYNNLAGGHVLPVLDETGRLPRPCLTPPTQSRGPRLGGTTGRSSELAPVLASAAMATGSIDGVFMEVHKDPSKALSRWAPTKSPSTCLKAC